MTSVYQREKSSDCGVISVTNASFLSAIDPLCEGLAAVSLPVYIVAAGEIGPEVAAAALLAPQRRTGHEATDRDEAAGQERLGGWRRLGIESLTDCLPCALEPRNDLLQTGAIAKQPNLPPHHVAN